MKGEIEQGKVPLKCPTEKCGKELFDSDLNQLLSVEEKDKYNQFTFN